MMSKLPHGVLFTFYELILCLFQVLTCPNASFTDLAEIVSRIEPVKPALMDGKSDTYFNNDTFSYTYYEAFWGLEMNF